MIFLDSNKFKGAIKSYPIKWDRVKCLLSDFWAKPYWMILIHLKYVLHNQYYLYYVILIFHQHSLCNLLSIETVLQIYMLVLIYQRDTTAFSLCQ